MATIGVTFGFFLAHFWLLVRAIFSLATSWGNFWQLLATLHSNIWSHFSWRVLAIIQFLGWDAILEEEKSHRPLRMFWHRLLVLFLPLIKHTKLVGLYNSSTPTLMAFTGLTHAHGPSPQPTPCRGQSYKHFMLINYDSRVVIWGIFQSGTTLES